MTRLQQLYRKYQDNTLSEKEESELLDLLKGRPPEEWNEVLEPLWLQYQSSMREPMTPEIRGRIWQQLEKLKEQEVIGMPGAPPASGMPELVPVMAKPSGHQRWIYRRIGIAAACLLLTACIYLLAERSGSNGSPVAQHPVIKPGADRAILKLANGKEILLADASVGELAEQGGVKIVKLDSGRLDYQGKTEGPVAYNMLTTPRGGQFQIVLPDGSHVWLNNSSSIRYPTGFTGAERVVELTGEAYFEIAKNVTMPFRVIAPGRVSVQVLGTSFNIMAYEDEGAVNTTLINGAVKVSAIKNSILIRPGEQASLPAGGADFSVSRPDLDQVLAWKDGKFSFDHADITAIMRQVARWYDVEIEYQGAVPHNGFFGNVSRKQNVEQLLEILQESGGVHLTLKGNKIIVMP